jgi:hypothetical protein
VSAIEHEAIIEPDERGRFALRKYLGNVPGARYRVYVDREAGRVTLELIED